MRKKVPVSTHDVKQEASLKPQDFFSARPVFTHGEFAAAIKSDERSRRTQDSLLAYYTKRCRLVRLRRGLYATVPPGADPARCAVDPYLLAAKLAGDAVLAYHTALEFHGKGHSVMEHFTYLTTRRSRPLVFRGLHFRAVPFPKVLRRKGHETFGVETGERMGVSVRVTNLERTLVDLLDRPDLGGGWEEIWRSLDSVEFFDLDLLVEYTLRLGNATTAAKVGYYLDGRREDLMVEGKHLRRLQERRPKEPHYLERSTRKRGRLVPGWNLVVPVDILERSWEEEH